MLNAIITLFLNSAALLIIAYLLPSFTITKPQYAFIAALFLSIINLVIKPILVILTLPITVLTLGLFILVLNAILFYFMVYLTPGVEITGFGNALFASVLFSIVSWALQTLFK